MIFEEETGYESVSCVDCVKYTRDWQLGLKKNFKDLVVIPIISTTQKMKFSVKDLFNPQFYADMVTFTKLILNEKVDFLCMDLCK